MRRYTLGLLQVSNTCIIPKSHSKVEFYDILNEHDVFLIETITAKNNVALNCEAVLIKLE